MLLLLAVAAVALLAPVTPTFAAPLVRTAVEGGGGDTGPKSRFAYVTVHYEGTSRDAEYVLGIQVLMQSIKLTGTPHDLVVLASESVTEQSKQLFRAIGCRVVDVTNIDNPFVGGTLRNKGFIFTLNKLHVWNMLEYERVVYLDADNVLVRNADELFLCGEFCAVFMNPCHFHTGLLVVTPSTDEYQRLLGALGHEESFDGADQGFLSSMYSKMLRKAQLFTPTSAIARAQQLRLAAGGENQDDAVDGDREVAMPKGMRLPVGYNINHKYFYEQYHWKLFYLRHFASMTSPISPVKVVVESARPIPALTVGFPMAPVLKPWYWWASFFMDLHAVWQDIRGTLPASQEAYGFEEAVKTLLGFFFALAFLTGVLYVLRVVLPLGTLQKKCMDMSLRNGKQARRAYLAFRIVIVLLAARIPPSRIHPLTPVHYGYSLTILMNVLLHVYVACVVSNFWNPLPDVTMPPVVYVKPFWGYVAALAASEFAIVWMSTWNLFPNVLWRLVFLFIGVFACLASHVQFYKLALRAEYGGKKERLRSL